MKATSLCLALSLAVAGGATSADAAVDRFGGNTELTGTATGWFHVEEIGGRWFFITPEGHAFFSLGVTHTGETIRQDEIGIFRSKYDEDEEKMGEFFLDRLRDWGYNSAGYGALPMMERRLPYVATIWTEGPRSKSAGDRSVNTDVFDPAVQQRLRGRVRTVAARHVDNPYCLGYVFMDLPLWTLQPQEGPNYVEFLRSLPEDAAGRRALSRFEAAHPEADDEALMVHIAETYYRVVCGELRRADPHHLILGDRFMAQTAHAGLHTPDSILLTAAKFVDVLSFQPMGTQRPIGSYLDHVLSLTGKPVLLADVNTMTMRPEKDARDTEEYERSAGDHTMAYYLDAAASKACIGIHRCTIRDYRPWDRRYHRRGLLRADDTPYSILIDHTRRTNQRVYELVYAHDEE